MTVYAEARTVTEDVFVEEQLETQVRKKVDSISVVFDRERSELDVVSIGGKDFIEDVGRAFCHSFSDDKPPLQPLIRTMIDFDRFRQRIALPLDDNNTFVHAMVDEISVLSPSGTLLTFDAKLNRGSRKDVYDYAEADLGERSPFLNPGWKVLSARIALFMPPAGPGRVSRIRAINLKPNGYTNLREQDDEDRFISDELMKRWGILKLSDGHGI